MKKKQLGLLISGVLMCGLMLGCNNKQTTAGNGNETTTAGAVYNIVEYQSENDGPYALLDDGRYLVHGERAFKYKLWVTQKTADGAITSSWVVLSDKPEVTYDEIEKQETSSLLTTLDEAEFVVAGFYHARIECTVDNMGRFIYNGKAYKDVMELTATDKDTSKKTVYSVLTNDTNITLSDIVLESGHDIDKFVVVDKNEIE